MFFELACGLSPCFPDGALLISNISHSTLGRDIVPSCLKVKSAPHYDRRSRLSRLLSWGWYTIYVTKAVLLARSGDVFLIVSNPPIVAPWVWLLSSLRRTRYAILIYDIYPNVLVQAGVLNNSGWITRIWRDLNRRTYKRADALITIGERMAQVIQQDVATTDPVVKVIPPWVNADFIKPLSWPENPFAADYVPPSKTVVLYSGNMGASHDIESILEAARILREHSNIFFLLIGGGEKFSNAETFATSHKLDNLKVLPWQAAERVPFTMALGDIALVALDEGMEDLMVPSKSFSYMAAGCAVIAIANEPSELSELLSVGNFGLLVAPKQPRKLADAILTLSTDTQRISEMRQAARHMAEQHYSRERGIAAFKSVLTDSGLMPRDDNS